MSDLPNNADVMINICIRKPRDGQQGYLIAYTKYPKLDGEDWNRGNDLTDGPTNSETLSRLQEDIEDLVAETIQ